MILQAICESKDTYSEVKTKLIIVVLIINKLLIEMFLYEDEY